MKGYDWSLGVGALFLLVSFFYWLILGAKHDNPAFWNGTLSALVAASVLFIALACWGAVGLYLSRVKETLRETLAQKKVTISQRSWHYRLQESVCSKKVYGDIADVKSECEYWARLLNGLFTLLVPSTLVMAIGWLFGANPSFTKRGDLFEEGQQRKGPVVLLAIVLVGISMAVWKWGPPSLPALHAPPIVTWYITAGVMGGNVLAILLGLLIARFIWPALRDFVSFLVARIVGLCRLITFA